MQKKYISHSAEETKKIGIETAKYISTLPALTHARIIDLQGNLGAGKTTFAKGFAKGLGITKTITSPTFVLMRRYSLGKKQYKNFFHIDAYRLSSFNALELIGIADLFSDPKNIIFIEWKKNVASKKIKPCGHIKFIHKTENERIIEVKTTH